jgi:hypothetical protein
MRTFDDVFSDWKKINNKLFKDKHSIDIHKELFELVGGDGSIVTDFKEVFYAPGLSICRLRCGNIYSYWTQGNYQGESIDLPAGFILAGPSDFPELALYQGSALRGLIVYGNESRVPPNDDLAVSGFAIDKNSIRIATAFGNGLPLRPGNATVYGTSVGFEKILILG